MDIFLLFESEGYSIMSEGRELEYHRYYKNILSLDSIKDVIEILTDDISMNINRYISEKESLGKVTFVFQDRFLLFKRMDVPNSSKKSDIDSIFEMEIMRKHRIDKDTFSSCFSRDKSDIEGYKSIGYTIFPKYYLELAGRVKNNIKARSKCVYFYMDYVKENIPEDFSGIFVLFRYSDAVIYSITKGLVENTMVVTEKSLDSGVVDYIRSSKNHILAGRENHIYKSIGIDMDILDENILVKPDMKLLDISYLGKSKKWYTLVSLMIALFIIAGVLNIYSGIEEIKGLNTELKSIEKNYSLDLGRDMDNYSVNKIKEKDIRLYSNVISLLDKRLVLFRASKNIVEAKFICDSKEDLYNIISKKEFRDFYVVSIEEEIIEENVKDEKVKNTKEKDDKERQGENIEKINSDLKGDKKDKETSNDGNGGDKKLDVANNKVNNGDLKNANISKETIVENRTVKKKKFIVCVRKDLVG